MSKLAVSWTSNNNEYFAVALTPPPVDRTHRMNTPLLHLNAVVMGDTGPAEFQPVVELVRRRLGGAALRWDSDFSAFRRSTESGWWPELIIVLQAWPDQYRATEVEELISLCPLARIVCCFGPWCDSDGRTRSIWPPGVRVPAAAFASRFEHELALLSGSRDVGSPLPLTASRTEAFEFDFARPIAPRPVTLDGSAVSPDRRFREMVAAALQKSGLSVGELSDTNPPAAVVFDADPWDGDRAAALAQIRGAHPRSQLVACVGFSRPHVEAELRDAGADAVWFKLSPLADLIDCLTAASQS